MAIPYLAIIYEFQEKIDRNLKTILVTYLKTLGRIGNDLCHRQGEGERENAQLYIQITKILYFHWMFCTITNKNKMCNVQSSPSLCTTIN